jgi:hypothetical protein
VVRAGTALFPYGRQRSLTGEKAGHDLLAAIPDAQAKDAGWEPAMVSMLLEGMRVNELPAWMIHELSSAELQSFVKRLRLAIADLALPRA